MVSFGFCLIPEGYIQIIAYVTNVELVSNPIRDFGDKINVTYLGYKYVMVLPMLVNVYLRFRA
jgi:hypothetical protein